MPGAAAAGGGGGAVEIGEGGASYAIGRRIRIVQCTAKAYIAGLAETGWLAGRLT